MSSTARYVSWFEDLTKDDSSKFGLKSEEVAKLLEANLFVPKGFAVSSKAYAEFVTENNFTNKIKHLLSSTNYNDPNSVKQVSFHIKDLFKKGDVSKGVVGEIISAYKKLGNFLEDAYVTVAPSPTHINNLFQIDQSQVKGDAALVEIIKDKWSVIFSPIAIFKLRENLLSSSPGVGITVQKIYEGNNIGSLNTQSSEITSEHFVNPKLKAELEEIGRKINKHYYFPQIVNWVFSDGTIYITSVRPITHPIVDEANENNFRGKGTRNGIISGVVTNHNHESSLSSLGIDSVLVTSHLTDDLLSKISNAKAVVLEKELNSKHLSEISVPVVFGVPDATKHFKNGDVITVNSVTGEVYRGGSTHSIGQQARSKGTSKTATKIFVNVGHSVELENISENLVDAVIYNPSEIIRQLGIHPKKLIQEEKHDVLSSLIEKEYFKILRLIQNKFVFFKLSDFTTQEYKNLLGGDEFETQDTNPHMGFRGSIRHLHQPDLLELELTALRETMNSNEAYLGIVIPFLRSTEELRNIIEILSSSGIKRSSRFRIWIEANTPANILSLEEYIQAGIDGVMINPLSLNSLLNGLDNNNFELSNHYKDVNTPLTEMISKAIEICHKTNTFLSIDQTQSINSEVLRQAIKKGIKSVAVSSSEVDFVKRFIIQTERELLRI